MPCCANFSTTIIFQTFGTKHGFNEDKQKPYHHDIPSDLVLARLIHPPERSIGMQTKPVGR